jgi:hypothetical protein
MTTASLRILLLYFTLSLGLAAAIAAAAIAPARAATHPPTLASDSGWPGGVVNRPGCGSDGDYDAHLACEAGRR